jgi:hypothetical protein
VAIVELRLDTRKPAVAQQPKIEDVSRIDGTDTVWVRRAARLVVDAPIVFRAAEGQDWLSGATVNISQTGVLFTLPAEASLPEGVSPSTLELQLVIYFSRAHTSADEVTMRLPDLHCVGRVIRLVEPVEGRRAVAMQIDRGWAVRSPSSVSNADGQAGQAE